MAQIIKHRRGGLESISGATKRAGELLVITGSTGISAGNGNGLLFVGIDGSTVTPANKILTGSATPDLTGGSYDVSIDGIPFYNTSDEKLYILGKGGNQEVKATANTDGTGIVSGSSQVVLQSADKTGFTGASSITTLGTITAGVWNGTAIANANLANDGITIDGADISLGGSVTTLQLGSTSSTALAGDTTTISGAQASAITANTAKTGITSGQASAITANTAKISFDSASSTKLGTIEEGAEVNVVDSVAGKTGVVSLVKGDVGLGNVDNESKATMFSSAALTGNSTAVTQADNDNSTKIATTAYVQREVSDLLGGAPEAFDTLLEISASIANGDSDVVALTTTVGTKLAKASNLSDLADAGTARTNLGVDAAGTDNSTDVTLAGSLDYLTISGQAITLGAITNDDLAGSIANAKLSNSSITIDGSAISLGGSVTTLQLGTSSSTALAGDTTTISGAQASAITANTAKTGITSGQASAITANTAKISYNSTASTKLGTIEENADVTDTANVTAAGALMDSEVTNLADVKAFDTTDYLASSTTTISAGQASAITANTAKVSATSSNVVAALSNQATDFGTGRVSGDDFGNVAGDSTFTGSFVGDGSGLTGLATNLTVNTADVNLLADDLDIVGTANEIEVSTAKVGNDVTVTVGIPTNPTLSGNVTVTGNLSVEGTTTTIDSTTVQIGDRVLELNYGGAAGDAGLLVTDATGGATVSGSLLWDASEDSWMAGALGSEKEVALLNASPTSNTVLKANASGLLVDSLITDDGTDVTISGTAELRINAATANSFVYFDSNKSIESVAASTAGDVIQWNGSSFVASNEIDGGTF
jgi:hypothetical protein